jgi:hypothetical protein
VTAVSYWLWWMIHAEAHGKLQGSNYILSGHLASRYSLFLSIYSFYVDSLNYSVFTLPLLFDLSPFSLSS